MPYKIRYAPKAQRDMEEVWSDVLEVSKETAVADKYVEDFADKIAEKKVFPNSGIPLYYRGLFTGFYSVNFKAYSKESPADDAPGLSIVHLVKMNTPYSPEHCQQQGKQPENIIGVYGEISYL